MAHDPDDRSGPAYANTDDAEPAVVLAALRQCCAAWEPGVRVMGNVRAGDIVRALDAGEPTGAWDGFPIGAFYALREAHENGWDWPGWAVQQMDAWRTSKRAWEPGANTDAAARERARIYAAVQHIARTELELGESEGATRWRHGLRLLLEMTADDATPPAPLEEPAPEPRYRMDCPKGKGGRCLNGCLSQEPCMYEAREPVPAPEPIRDLAWSIEQARGCGSVEEACDYLASTCLPKKCEPWPDDAKVCELLEVWLDDDGPNLHDPRNVTPENAAQLRSGKRLAVLHGVTWGAAKAAMEALAGIR